MVGKHQSLANGVEAALLDDDVLADPDVAEVDEFGLDCVVQVGVVRAAQVHERRDVAVGIDPMDG